jgi:hypothetical protein
LATDTTLAPDTTTSAATDTTFAPDTTTTAAPDTTTTAAPDTTTTVAPVAAAPTIASDLPDYGAGDAVTLSGANWQGDTTVHIFVNDNDGQTWTHDVNVAVNDDGTITDSFFLPSWFVATYAVTATGADTGRVATTTFTDPTHVRGKTYHDVGTLEPTTVARATPTRKPVGSCVYGF